MPKIGKSTFPRLPYTQASDLGLGEPPNWVIAPWVIQGVLTDIVGLPKGAGKSHFVRTMIRNALRGSDFLGYPTQRLERAFYLTEEDPNEVRESLDALGFQKEELARLHILFWAEVAGKKWAELCAALTADLIDAQCPLLVVDTLSTFALQGSESENDAATAIAAVKPLRLLATKANCGVVTVRHARKGRTDIVSSGRGSTGWVGSMGIIATLNRINGSETKRELRTQGRFSRHMPRKLRFEWEDLDYTLITKSEGSSNPKENFLSYVKTPKSTRELMNVTGMAKGTLLKKLRDFDHLLEKTGFGTKSDPYRYHLKKEIDTDSES